MLLPRVDAASVPVTGEKTMVILASQILDFLISISTSTISLFVQAFVGAWLVPTLDFIAVAIADAVGPGGGSRQGDDCEPSRRNQSTNRRRPSPISVLGS